MHHIRCTGHPDRVIPLDEKWQDGVRAGLGHAGHLPRDDRPVGVVALTGRHMQVPMCSLGVNVTGALAPHAEPTPSIGRTRHHSSEPDHRGIGIEYLDQFKIGTREGDYRIPRTPGGVHTTGNGDEAMGGEERIGHRLDGGHAPHHVVENGHRATVAAWSGRTRCFMSDRMAGTKGAGAGTLHRVSGAFCCSPGYERGASAPQHVDERQILSNFHVTESGKTLVTLIPGDGIGPEVVDATIRIIEATGAPIEWEERHAGERVFLEGQASGVRQDTIESIRKTRVVMKGPLGTPVGYGEKSANVTLRKLFETYGNIRPAREYPGVKTPYSGRGIDLVVVRENVEDLYAGIEYMLTPGVAQGLKLISRKGTEKIVRLAFELARAEGRESVVAMSKANIMKMTEGTLKSVFEEVSLEYDDIESWHVIVDNAAHQLVKLPEQYSVLVTTNMNGDILSDLSSALIGGLGFAPSANIGNEVFIAEAVHGSAPKYAGKDVINPTAMILSGVMMLRHLDMFEEAALIENAVITTLEEGKVMTRDVVGDERQGGTTGYTNEIIKNLGKKPTDWKIREYKPIKLPQLGAAPDFVKVKTRQVCGVDIFIESASDKISIGQSMERICEGRDLYLKMVDSRGTMLYPPNDVMTDTVDAWRARFMLRDDAAELNDAQLIDLLQAVAAEHMWAHVEKLQRFDGEDGFTKAQGED